MQISASPGHYHHVGHFYCFHPLAGIANHRNIVGTFLIKFCNSYVWEVLDEAYAILGRFCCLSIDKYENISVNSHIPIREARPKKR